MPVRNPLVLGADGLPQTIQSGDILSSAQNGNPTPRAFGYNTWSCDPVFCSSNKSPNSAQMLAMLTFPSAAVASGGTLNIEHNVAAVNTTITYARIGVYSYNAGTGIATLIGTSADLSTTWNTTGIKTVSVTITPGIAPGDLVYIAFLISATTTGSFTASTGVVAGLGRGTPARYGQLNSQATLPSTFTPASTIVASVMPFLAY